jgi:hypothetical protein
MERTLFRTIGGSRLHGTDRVESDFDLKRVFVPAPEDILLTNTIKGRRESGSFQETPSETEHTPVRTFLSEVSTNRITALEILFTPDHAILDMGKDWPSVSDEAKGLLCRDTTPFVDYVRRHANRFAATATRVRDAVEALRVLVDEERRLGSSGTCADAVPALMALGLPHVRTTTIPWRDGRSMEHLDVCGKRTPFTASIKTAREAVQLTVGSYGERARRAASASGGPTDWKALSHGLRVAGQAVEFLKTGRMTFPRPDAGFLLDVKEGRLALDHVTSLLEESEGLIEEAARKSPLPEAAVPGLADRVALRLHSGSVLERLLSDTRAESEIRQAARTRWAP